MGCSLVPETPMEGHFELNVESYRRKKATSDKQTRRDNDKEKAKPPRQTAGTE